MIDETPPLRGYFFGTNRRSMRPIALTALLFLFLGVVIGGWLFSRSQPRSIIALKDCDHCLSLSDLTGLMGSVGMLRFGHVLPFVVTETDLSVVIKNPFPTARIHYVIVPKKDIKDLTTIRDEDYIYVDDAMRIIRTLVNEEHLRSYRVFSNGPGLQDVTYLHFHLVSNERRNVKPVEEELASAWRQRSEAARAAERR